MSSTDHRKQSLYFPEDMLEEIQRAKPASAKGRYLKKMTVSSTMGPGVKIDLNRLRPEQV